MQEPGDVRPTVARPVHVELEVDPLPAVAAAMFDWMRAWPIDTGRRVTNGNRMKVGTHNATC